MVNNICKFIFLITLVISPQVAFATFIITPTKVFMKSQEKVSSLSLKNEDDEEASFQVAAFKWTKEDGKEQLVPANDIMVTPTVLTIPPQQTQLLRIAQKQIGKRDVEAAYRVFIKQLPRKPKEGADVNNEVSLILEFSVPVFIAPTTLSENDLSCSIEGSKNKPSLSCKNTLNQHVYVSEMETFDANKSKKVAVNKYIFPNEEFKAPLDKQQDLSKVKVALTTFYGDDKTQVGVGYQEEPTKAERDVNSNVPPSKE